jgi:hypothetical protein
MLKTNTYCCFFSSPKYPVLKPSTCWPLKTIILAYLLWISGSQAPSMVRNHIIIGRWWLDDMANYTCKMFKQQVYPLVFFVETYTMQPIFVLWEHLMCSIPHTKHLPVVHWHPWPQDNQFIDWINVLATCTCRQWLMNLNNSRTRTYSGWTKHLGVIIGDAMNMLVHI